MSNQTVHEVKSFLQLATNGFGTQEEIHQVISNLSPDALGEIASASEELSEQTQQMAKDLELLNDPEFVSALEEIVADPLTPSLKIKVPGRDGP